MPCAMEGIKMRAEILIQRGYEERIFSFYGVHQLGEALIKVYGISRDGSDLAAPVVDTATSLASAFVGSQPMDAPVGFVIVHVAREAVFYVLCCWNDENMLRIEVFRASLSAPEHVESIVDTRIVACVWELEIIAYERDLWVSEVLGPKTDSLRAYLNRYYGEINE